MSSRSSSNKLKTKRKLSRKDGEKYADDGAESVGKEQSKPKHKMSTINGSIEVGTITTFFQKMPRSNSQDKPDDIPETTAKSLKHKDSRKEQSSKNKDKEKRKKESVVHDKPLKPIIQTKDVRDVSTSKKHKSNSCSSSHKVNKSDSYDLRNDTEIVSSMKIKKLPIDTTKNSNNESVIEITSEEKNHYKKEMKNAFSFMMESRYKSIGQNSPGKDAEKIAEDSPSLTSANKDKLATRKALFQNWADLKGAKKRKTDDEELGKTIDYKLKKRAKRFKKMLTQEGGLDEKSEKKNCKTVVGGKHIQDSNDVDSDEVVVNKQRQNITTSICLFSESSNSECTIISDTITIKKALQQTELSNFFGTLNKSNKTKALPGELNVYSTTIHKSEASNSKNGDTDDNTINLESDIVENNFTPRTKRKWKMRLRLSLDAIDDNLIDSFSKSMSNKKSPLQPLNENSLHSNNLNDNTSNMLLLNDIEDTNSHKGKKDKQLEVNTFYVNSDSDNDQVSVVTKSQKKQLDHHDNKRLPSNVKVAPVFLKAIPKPKIDKQVLLARKKFLESGIPDELRRFQEKQEKLLNRKTPMFPKISHITVQPTEQEKKDLINFWNLPPVTLDLLTNTQFTPPTFLLELGMLTNSTSKIGSDDLSHQQVFLKDVDVKIEIKKIKKENPDYPVFKLFRFCTDAFSKSVIEIQDTPKKSKRSRKRQSKVVQYKLWTDLYKPHSCDEMFSNYSNVKKIKKWLQTWLEFNDNNDKHKRKRKSYASSSSDFEVTETDSRDSTDVPRNTLILYGPHGSGKTSAVHAICSELGIVILESNASSKRTGKVLLQQLQQIAQSHELQGAVHDFLTNESEIKVSPKRMHLLLIEDVDIVFDQDESFLSGVNQLIGTSKLPIILTTTDLNCLHLKKLVSRHTVINFLGVSGKVLAPWFQILCLVEGVSVHKQFVAELLQECNGDVRSALLQLQFLVHSSNVSDISYRHFKRILKGISIADESNISLIAKDESITEVSANNYLERLREKYCDTLIPIDIGQIWWSIPQFLEEYGSSETENKKNDRTETDSDALLQVCEAFNVCATIDLFYTNCVDCDLEPVHRNRSLNLKASLEEGASSDNGYFNRSLIVEMSHVLVNGYITSKRTSTTNVIFDRGVNEKRWRAKQYKCEEKLLGAVPLTHHLNRTALTDYLSTLRSISRSESDRAKGNSSKRKNRFYHYLSGLGVSFNDSILKTTNGAFSNDSS